MRTPEGHEVDFLARFDDGRTELIQVCADASGAGTGTAGAAGAGGGRHRPATGHEAPAHPDPPGPRRHRPQHGDGPASLRVDPDPSGVSGSRHPSAAGCASPGAAICLPRVLRGRVGSSIDSRAPDVAGHQRTAMDINNRNLDGSIIHSNHGTQFTSWAFTQSALDSGLAVSMARSGTVTILPSSSRSVPACKSSCSTGDAEEPVWSCPTRSSSVLRTSKTGSDDTHHSAHSRPSSMRFVTPQPSEIRQADRTKHKAHLRLHSTR